MILIDKKADTCRPRILDVLSSDRYVFTRERPITYTNATKDKLTLTKNKVFWYMVVGHSEIISEHQYGQGPVFRLSDIQIEKLSELSDPKPTPEFTKRRKTQHKKFVATNKVALAQNLKNAIKNAVKNRGDDSDHHIKVEYPANGSIVATTNIDLGGKVKHGRIVRIELSIGDLTNNLRFRIIMPTDVEKKTLILRTPFVKDTLAIVERLKSFLALKYDLQFEAAYFGSATLYGFGHDGKHFSWSSTYHIQ